MIYIKKDYGSALELRIDVYEDEFYCTCPRCGKEVHLDEKMLKELVNCDCDFVGTAFLCNECSSQGYSER